MAFVSFRTGKEIRKAVDELARLERRDRSDEYRQIFATGIAERRKQVALDNYSRGEVSFGRATEMAGVSPWEFAELLEKQGTTLNVSAEQVLKAAEKIRF